ncbi:putative dolichol kinase [Phytophthora cinnamomi]|uniref:putative dolichol kinase n=1 Tax=Phytophthora cinnamomi TaxID=4785 RepID=UPI00355A7680|nr:putative dolichol kinase [Phytophthora cinnamomi]
MPRKASNESRRAQVAEALALVVATGWATHLVQKEEETAGAGLQAEQQLLQAATMSHVLLVLHILGFCAVVRSIFRPRALSKTLRQNSRQERDAGLVVGCVLPPLVLLSRLLAEIYQDQVFSSATFFYAWTSVSVGVSALLKVAVFGSVTSLSVNILVDAVLLPAAFGLLSPVEAEWRFLLATGGRVFVTTALAAGFKLLPRSFTVGEALLVAQGVGLCAYDLVLSTANRLNEYDVIDLPPNVLHPWLLFDVDRPDYVLALQVGMLGSLLVCIALTPLLRLYGAPSPTTVAHTLPFKGTVGFVLTASMVAGGMVYPWSGFLLQTWNPFGWLLDFLSESRSLPSFLPPRFALMGYWATCLAVLVPFFAFIADRFALRNIVARKLFHLLVVLMLGPASLFDAPMLALSYGVALGVFFLVECIRALALPPFGRSIAEFMRSFIDHREAGQIILTHSYLLLGCALPLWLVPSVSEPSALVMNAGVLALGVGDAMGAVVGSSVGRHKVFGGKTLEGSAAVFLSILIASIPLHDYHTRAYVHGEYIQFVLLTFAVFLTSVLEAATAQIDNLVLPLFFYAACNLVNCHRQ